MECPSPMMNQPMDLVTIHSGTVATFNCMTGFGLVGAASSTCGGDGSSPMGTFDPANPTCERENTPAVDMHDSV